MRAKIAVASAWRPFAPASAHEKAVWWERAVDAWPDYAKYQTKTDRQIPVFVLESMA